MTNVYYMPYPLNKRAEDIDDEDTKMFSNIFKVFPSNVSFLDRTGTIKNPFPTKIAYPIPDLREPSGTFSEVCIERAEHLLRTNDTVEIMYSGGLDSTVVLLSFRAALKKTGRKEQVKILTTPEGQRENPVLWDNYVLPNFELVNATDALANWPGEDVTRVQGEHADQLFGSDKVFTKEWLMNASFSEENLLRFLTEDGNSYAEMEMFTHGFTELVKKSPVPIVCMRDFLWWVNFTCKWQCVALRTLAFSDSLGDASMSFDEFNRSHGSFFNSEEFQLLSMTNNLIKWGDKPSPRSYKFTARQFIEDEMPELADYCANKVKVGSLYNVVRQRYSVCEAIDMDENGLLTRQDISEVLKGVKK